jgi:hypothetical protein
MCVHHWKIDPPEGPFSKGVCKLCNAEREFRNWQTNREYSDWGTDSKNSDVIVTPISDNSMDLIAKLSSGKVEAINGYKC